nr:hypothetical protein [Tanacetum cinerariifolium]
MSTQQDIYVAGFENRPSMLNKDNYVPWSGHLLRYAKSKPNGKSLYSSIMHALYVKRMIPEPGDLDLEVPNDLQRYMTLCAKSSSKSDIQNVGNQNGLIVVPKIENQNGNGIQLQVKEFDLIAYAGDIEEIEEVNANCILMANLQQASSSDTQADKAPVYDSDGSAEVHQSKNCYNNKIFNMFNHEEQYIELLESVNEPHPAQQNDNIVIFADSNVEHSGGTVDQNLANVEATHAYFESLYNNLVTEVEKVNTVNRKMRETNAELTTKLARYKGNEKCFKINQEKYDKLERCYQKSVYQ